MEWIGTTSVKQVTEKIRDGGVDLVISTVNLDPPPEEIPVVRISPLPGRREIMQLKERLYLAAPLTFDSHLVGELMEIIQRHADIRNAGRLAIAVRKWLEDRVFFQKQRTGRAVNATHAGCNY